MANVSYELARTIRATTVREWNSFVDTTAALTFPLPNGRGSDCPAYFEQRTAEIWMQMQSNYELWRARQHVNLEKVSVIYVHHH